MYTDNYKKQIRELFFIFSCILAIKWKIEKNIFTLYRFKYHDPSAHRAHICLNNLQKHIWWFSQNIRDATEKILFWVYRVSILLSRFLWHHQEGYCEVGSKRIIFLQIAFFWINGVFKNNYATTCWSTPLPHH